MLARLYRPFYVKLMFPIGKFSVRLGLTPNFWTVTSLVFAAISGVLLYRGSFVAAILVATVMLAADILDGATARAGDMATPFGTVLDHSIDRYAEFMLLAGLLLGGWVSGAAIMFAASGVVMASYVRAKAESAGKLEACLGGIAGRAEKLFLLFWAVVALAAGYPLIGEILVWVIGAISHITFLQRLLYSRRHSPK